MASTAKPLNGFFDIKLQCMGGHVIFLELTENEAYHNCPGHRSRDLIGRVTRNANSVTLFPSRDDQPAFRIDWDGSKYTLHSHERSDDASETGKNPIHIEVDQVTNPWRLWIPRMLPED